MKNFLQIVPEKLSKDNYDTLIFQGGCNEITNIKIVPGSPATAVSEWKEKVRISRTKMFNLAQSSLKNNKSLQRVIIIKSLPRYEPKNVDTNSIKSNLNQFGNSIYNNLWMESGCPSNIIIKDQHMDCQGPLREKRFGNPGQIGSDGKVCGMIHMRGRLAVRHFTNSYIRILSECLHPQDNYKSDNYQHQRGNHGYRQTQGRQNHSRGQAQHREGHGRQNGYQQNSGHVRVSNRFANLGNY